jgi:hypothetical protein
VCGTDPIIEGVMKVSLQFGHVQAVVAQENITEAEQNRGERANVPLPEELLLT